ncbi:hypothetical protein BDQ17DRAFT_1420025 [Cyathus striatus]|nr:hypothetical protein BDQ17DRAFT_1420025 [Cyathus striatus]
MNSFILLSTLFIGAIAKSSDQITIPPTPDWSSLKKQVGGRLFQGTPSQNHVSQKTSPLVPASRFRRLVRADQPGGYIQTQWETCQKTGEQCLLDYLQPTNEVPTRPPAQCKLGSIPSYFIDVRTAQDVAAAFVFTKKYNVPLVIKNTGHDYKGRSSAPGSLALWTHNLKNMSYDPLFIPHGCSKASPAVTMGAGIQWLDAYAFADKNNITLVGGSDRSVGSVGGWLQGGGHGALSNTMGLGVDRVLQYKVVTPDGKLRIANACQNEDLFFALRGGGGGTFGVVLEASILASPQVTLQSVIFTFTGSNTTLTRELWTVITDNGLKWAEEGWGGYGMANVAIYINPKISKEDAANSMAPLIAFGEKLQAQGVGTKLIVTEFPSWNAFFQVFSTSFVAVRLSYFLFFTYRLMGIGPTDNRIQSRPCFSPNPQNLFQHPISRSTLVEAMISANAATPGLIILIAAPASFTGDGRTSPWNWNATAEEKKGHYDTASESIDNLRRITPDAAYLNEADVYEPNHEEAFWGEHYPELLNIKQKYDPDHLLDCWHCVGSNPSSSASHAIYERTSTS